MSNKLVWVIIIKLERNEIKVKESKFWTMKCLCPVERKRQSPTDLRGCEKDRANATHC